MPMEKRYFLRGKPVIVEEFDAIVAVEVRKGHTRLGSAWEELLEAIHAHAGDATELADAETELRAFVAAGWIFERRSDAMERALAQDCRLPATERVARIFLQRPN